MDCTQREAAIKFRRLPFQIDAIFNKYINENNSYDATIVNPGDINHILRDIEEEVIKLFGNNVLTKVVSS